MRGVGVGEAVLAEILSLEAARGATALDVPALPGDGASKSFLEDMGFRGRLLIMGRSLEFWVGAVNATTLCVGVVDVEQGALLRIVRRGHEPGAGRWSVPGGRVENGETLAKRRREARRKRVWR